MELAEEPLPRLAWGKVGVGVPHSADAENFPADCSEAGKFIFCPKGENCQGKLGLKVDLATVQLMKLGKMVRSMAGQTEEGFRNRCQLDAPVSSRFNEDPTCQGSSLLHLPLPSQPRMHVYAGLPLL